MKSDHVRVIQLSPVAVTEKTSLKAETRTECNTPNMADSRKSITACENTMLLK